MMKGLEVDLNYRLGDACEECAGGGLLVDLHATSDTEESECVTVECPACKGEGRLVPGGFACSARLP